MLIASGGIGAMLVLALWVRHPWAPARHAAPRQRLDATPPVLAAAPAPWPEMVTGCACGVQSGEHKLWCQPADAALDWAARNELLPPGDWTDQLLAGLHSPGQQPRGMTEPLDDLLREDGMAGDGTPGCPRAVPGGAGDESEGYGLTAPPAPPAACPCCGCRLLTSGGLHCLKCGWLEPGSEIEAEFGPVPVPTRQASATEVANAHADAFMAAMRADHAAWMASARERWAAA